MVRFILFGYQNLISQKWLRIETGKVKIIKGINVRFLQIQLFYFSRRTIQVKDKLG